MYRQNVPLRQAPITTATSDSPDSPDYMANWGGRGPPGLPFGHATDAHHHRQFKLQAAAVHFVLAFCVQKTGRWCNMSMHMTDV